MNLNKDNMKGHLFFASLLTSLGLGFEASAVEPLNQERKLTSSLYNSPFQVLEPPLNRTRPDYVYDSNHPGACLGYYILPVFPEPQPAPGETQVESDQARILVNGESVLTGDVRLTQTDVRLDADEVRFFRDEATGEITTADAYGRVLIEDPEVRATGSRANIQFENNRVSIFDSEFRIYDLHGRGTSEQVVYQDGQPTLLYGSTYTTCDPGSNVWEIRAKRVVLDDEANRGQAFNSTLYLKGVPVFYSPYVSFPLRDERKTGFLMPSYTRSSRSGSEIAVPYYFNLAPNYDATFTTRWLEERGTHLQGAFRYLQPHHEGNLQLGFIPDDRKWSEFRQTVTATPAYGPNDPRQRGIENASDNRFMVSWVNFSEYSPHWRGLAEFNYVSDDDYFEDLGRQFANFSSTTQTRILPRTADVIFEDEVWDFRALVQDYQILQPYDLSPYNEPYRILPQLSGVGRFPDKIFDLDATLGLQFSRFDQGTDFVPGSNGIVGLSKTTGNRYNVMPVLTRPMRRSYGYITPRLALHTSYYQLDVSPRDRAVGFEDTRSVIIPITSLDTGLIFERDFNLFGQSFLQTFEPRLYYLYVPFRDQSDVPVFDSALIGLNYDQLFRPNRFSGRDRVGDANQLAIGLVSRFFEDQGGRERARISVGQLIYFRDREVQLLNRPISDTDQERFSNLIGQAQYYFSTPWAVTADVQADPNEGVINQKSLRVTFSPAARKSIYLSYRDDKNNPLSKSGQTDLGVTWQLNPRWNVLGRQQYDFTQRINQLTFAGVEYENCCWAVRVGAERNKYAQAGGTFKIDTTYVLQFILKGLTSFGEGYGGVEFGIPGYRDELGTTY